LSFLEHRVEEALYHQMEPLVSETLDLYQEGVVEMSAQVVVVDHLLVL
jgi:hypothetical protein